MTWPAAALAALVLACGARTEILAEGAVTPEAGADSAVLDASVAESSGDTSAMHDAVEQPEAGSDASCGVAPPQGQFACCNGQACRGACSWPSNGCSCGGIQGGCWGQSVCCTDSCVLPGDRLCVGQ